MSFRILKWKLPLSKKFMYNDNWGMSEIYIDSNEGFVTDHIGLPNDDLDSAKYHWGSVKLPKGKTWDRDSFMHKIDKEYMFSHISFYDAEPDMYIRFKCRNGWGFEIMPIVKLSLELQEHIREYLRQWGQLSRTSHIVINYKQPAIYLTIKDYRSQTYYELMREFEGLGRHFEACLLELKPLLGCSLALNYVRRLKYEQVH